MSDNAPTTFIVDCPVCKAKVAAHEQGRIDRPGGVDQEGDVFYGISVSLGECPKCKRIIVGESQQVAIGGYESYEDEWADSVRVYPDPPKKFTSSRIPKVVTDSISEGQKSLQASANMAACVMFGRALEATCHDLLESKTEDGAVVSTATTTKHSIMLGQGIRRLKDEGYIDQRLYDWSQQLRAFRNLAAHATDVSISREEVDDLRSFVFAIIEYIYDLTDRYNEFTERLARKKKD